MQEPQRDTNTITTPSTPIEIVQAFLDALSAKDVDHALTLMSDDVEYQNVPFPPARGRARAERALRAMTRVPGKFSIRIHNIAERSGVVLTERTDSLHARWLDLDFWACGTFELRAGKITRWRDHFDLGTLVLQTITGPLRALLRAPSRQPAS